MSSELTQVANAIRSVGASAGPVVTGVAAARQRASALSGRIPGGVPSAGAAIGSLEQAVSQLNAAAEQLAMFSQRADEFAQRLVMGDSPQSLALARARQDAERASPDAHEAGSVLAPSVPTGGAAAPPWAAERNLEEFDVDCPDFSDNPIREDWGEHGRTREDYVWAASSWRDVVRPGLDRGLTQADFEAMDARSGAAPLRRHADVYSLYVGDPITLSEEPGGRWTVNSGRHRLEAAHLIGDAKLFGKLFRRK